MQDRNELIQLIKSIHDKQPHVYSPNDLKGIEAYEALREQPVERQKDVVLELSGIIVDFIFEQVKPTLVPSYPLHGINRYRGERIVLAIQTGLLRRKLNYTEDEWIALFGSFFKATERMKQLKNKRVHFGPHQFPITYALKQLDYLLKGKEASAELLSYIEKVLIWVESSAGEGRHYYGSDLHKATRKLQALLSTEETYNRFELKTNDIGEAINQIIGGISEKTEPFDRIFFLAEKASASKPSRKMSKEVMAFQDQIGLDTYRKIAHQILRVALSHDAHTETYTYNYGDGSTYTYHESTFLCQPSQTFVKGIVWTLARFSDKETVRLVSELGEMSYQKIPGKGPKAASIGNACMYVLGNMRGKDGLGALARLKLRIRQNSARKIIDSYLTEGAKKYNVSVEELKEMAVPDFQLEKGKKAYIFDDYQLEVEVVGKKVMQQWVKPDGNPMKSVPAAIKKSTSLSKKLQQARKEIKEIQKVFSAQKQRIDNQFILERNWDWPSFEKYYLNHGLIFPLTQKLIWTFAKGDKRATAIWLDGRWHTAEHDIVKWIDAETTVSLWHPVHADEATVLQWREKMLQLEWKQPIKQAFREIYLLTDAELNTRNYSNRMAAHILKQHQFNSLASLRGWKYSLMGAYDDGRYNETCHRYLPEYGITAEYWIDELNADDAFNDTGIWLYVATDQVKFKNADGDTMELVDVPQIVFSEIMRDVDMFVGVASVGNDPEWGDNNGERQTYRDYWTSYSFGDLTEIAKTRKTILERLLPRLKKIRDKARIEGKFLVVEGNLRTYKIHIGSGNILMEPNDQYLCIVPARSAENTTDKLFIPFEGDKGLSIVLSKAFLLAEDQKITDTTITSQINRA